MDLQTSFCAVAAVLAVGVLGSVVLSRPLPPLWLEHRAIGAPIEGYWYPTGAGGCFADYVVTKIEPDREATIAKGISVTFGTNLVSSVRDGQVVIEMNLPRRKSGEKRDFEYVPSRLEYQDLGSELRMTGFTQAGESAPEANLGVGTLKRCGEHSLWSRISLAWRASLDPGSVTEVRNPWVD